MFRFRQFGVEGVSSCSASASLAAKEFWLAPPEP
jgi:hypothetical protein